MAWSVVFLDRADKDRPMDRLVAGDVSAVAAVLCLTWGIMDRGFVLSLVRSILLVFECLLEVSVVLVLDFIWTIRNRADAEIDSVYNDVGDAIGHTKQENQI